MSRALSVAGLCVAASVLPIDDACAGAILSPTAVVNNSLGEFTVNYVVENLINQSGLSVGFSSGVTDFDAYLGASPTHTSPSLPVGVGFASLNSGAIGVIDFDLGDTYTVHRFALWNDEDFQALGPFSLEISDDSTFASSTFLGAFVALVDTLPVTAQVFDLVDGTGRYLRLNVGGATIPGSMLVNFGEIALDASIVQATPVPEPTSIFLWVLIALGAILFSPSRVRLRSTVSV
jgi:hypothetical protein